ncbi:hypothetical protein ACX16L_23180 [Bacillus cereus]
MINKMYTECESSFDEWLEKVKSYEEVSLTEADTRSKLIDSLFIDVLGWDETQIHREGHVNKIGFYDYDFNSGRNRFVLEAKKTDVNFLMPKNKTTKYKALKDKNSKLKEAIEQGVNYAAVRNIDIVVVFNGKQLAVTYIPYSKATNKHDTYLFQDLEDIHNSLLRFYNLLSPLVNGKEETAKIIVPDSQNILIRNRPSFVDKINTKQADFGLKSKGNELAKYFEQIHGEYFSDITSDEEFLKKCYCESEIAGKLERELEIVLRDTAPLNDFPIEEIQTKKRSAGNFQTRFIENNKSTKMFLLLGGSGVGKTTFIFRFFNYILSADEREFLVWLYLDFKKMSEEGKSIDDFVNEELEDQLSEKYEDLELYTDPEKITKIFAKDLKKQRGSIALLPTEEDRQRAKAETIREVQKDKLYHIKRIFEYLRSIGYGTCIVYDNVDQLNTDLQKRLFKHANVLRENLKTTVICSLREEVYYDHRKEKVLNFSEIERFHIPSPRLTNVLSKRIKLLKENTDPDDIFSMHSEDGKFVNVKKSEIIDVLTQTFLGDNENVLMLEMLANKDLRDALKYFRKVITSHNINFDEVLISAGMYAISKSTNKIIDSSQILRGLALQDKIHFNGNSSEPLINIFSVESDGFFSHFTKIRILKYAQSLIYNSIGHLPQGYFKVSDMYKEVFSNTVNDLESFMSIVKKLQKVGAIVNYSGSLNELNEEDYITLGPAGKYYLDVLIYNPFYVSLMAIDTTMTDPVESQEIEKIYSLSLSEKTVIQTRRYLAMSRHFVKYLVEEEEKEVEFLKAKGLELNEEYFSIAKNIQEGYEAFIKKNGLDF